MKRKEGNIISKLQESCFGEAISEYGELWFYETRESFDVFECSLGRSVSIFCPNCKKKIVKIEQNW